MSSTTNSPEPLSSSVICKEVFDDGYQPSNEEIVEYATKIGIDPDKEPYLLTIARHGLMQALPSDWQPCYNEQYQAYYYYNILTKETQWDHPLDAIYKNLVEKARRKVNGGDISEDLDSGIKSLQGNEDSDNIDLNTADISPEPKKMDNFYGNRFANDNKRGNILQPLEPLRMGTRLGGGQIQDGMKTSNSVPQSINKQQIGLGIKNDSRFVKINSSGAIVKDEKATSAPVKGFTLTGTGSMFLKSNTKKIEVGNLENDTSKPLDIEKKFTSERSSTLIGPNVKSILRDSSLTDVRSKSSDAHSDIEDRKSVRFNLINVFDRETTEGKNKDDIDDNIVGKTTFKRPASAFGKPVDHVTSSEESSDGEEEEVEEDEWDFDIGDENEEKHVREVKVIPTNKNSSTVRPLRPMIKIQSSIEESVEKPINKLIESGQTFIADNETNDSSVLFDKTVENRRGYLVKPLYDDSDSESPATSIKNYPGKKESFQNGTAASTSHKDGNRLQELKLKEDKSKLLTGMLKELEEFKIKIDKDRMNEENKIKEEMQLQLDKLKKEIAEKNKSELEMFELEALKIANKQELDKLIEEEKLKFQSDLTAAMEKLLRDNKEIMQKQMEEEEKKFSEILKHKRLELEELHKNKLFDVESDIETKLAIIRKELEDNHHEILEDYKARLKSEFEEKRKKISNEHRSAVEILQRNHAEILQELERDLKMEEELLKKEHSTNLAQLKIKLAHELEIERQKMRETGEDRLYEKIRCEKRLLEDKYRCLKEKYIRLKTEFKLTLERRNNRRREQQQQQQQQQQSVTTTGSETERSNSNKQNSSGQFSVELGKPPAAPLTPKQQPKFREQLSTGLNSGFGIGNVGNVGSGIVHEKSQEFPINGTKDKNFGAAAKYLKHIQQYNDDTTSISQSDTTISNNYNRIRYIRGALGDNGNSDSEAIRSARNQENYTKNFSNNNNNNNVKELTPGRQRKKLFTRMKSASTSRLNSSNKNDPGRPCTPVENLRRQLQKLEDLEDQFPDSTLDTTYHLRYPFSDVVNNYASTSSELEFFKHRIHLERDSVRRAKESLRTQRTNFRARQREIKLRHKGSTRHTLDQLIQEEKELTEMEVNLHRTRALLGEKVIRLRHLEQSLQRIYEKEKPIDFTSDDTKCPKDDATLSDLSSHSSSGFSSTDFASDTNHLNVNRHKDMYQESSEILQSLENLNAEIKEIWEILSKQQAHGIPPPPTTLYSPEMGWSLISPTIAQTQISTTPVTSTILHHASVAQPTVIPTLADRLETYRQVAAIRGTTASGGIMTAPTVNTIVSQSPLAGHYTTSLVERTRDLRNWLRQAKNEHELLTGGQQADL